MGDRTPDLCNAIAALSQLSYGPIVAGLEFPARRCPYLGSTTLASGVITLPVDFFKNVE